MNHYERIDNVKYLLWYDMIEKIAITYNNLEWLKLTLHIYRNKTVQSRFGFFINFFLRTII